MIVQRGSPAPLGATVLDGGINFAYESSGARTFEVLVYATPFHKEPCQVVLLERGGGDDRDVFYGFVPGLPNGTLYNLRVSGPYTPELDGKRFNENKPLVDPYAVAIAGDSHWMDDGEDPLGYDNSRADDPGRHLIKSSVSSAAPKCVAYRSDFDWKSDKPLHRPWCETIIYEAHLKGFTGHPNCNVGDRRGTYLGFAAPRSIAYLKSLGITAVELMPIMEFDRHDNNLRNLDGHQLVNFWGYNTVGYRAPESHYAHYGKVGQQVDELKLLVRELHAAGIEVILDVVFNHTREGNHFGPTMSLRGLDNQVWYMLVPDKPQYYLDFSGCGNTLNASHPRVQRFILGCLRYWVTEFHVDGFRFDLASTLHRDGRGGMQLKSALVTAIEQDEVLRGTKLIAEAWDVTEEGYRLGSFSDRRWWEWNGKFRDLVRRHIKGDTGVVPELAARIHGSHDMFPPDTGRGSINFVACHDGFTLRDVFSYNEKHNDNNGEGNRDGHKDNHSWNCGAEGDSFNDARQEQAVMALRRRLVKNSLCFLFGSLGCPMLYMGDEMFRTSGGNNNIYPQEELNLLNWDLVESNADILRFTRMLIQFYTEQRISRRPVRWHGTLPDDPHHTDESRFVAWEFLPLDDGDPIEMPAFYASNSWWEALAITLPALSDGKRWYRVVDTNLVTGEDIMSADQMVAVEGDTYIISARSFIILVAR